MSTKREIDLRRKSFVILGGKGEGKTVLADNILTAFKGAGLYYDTVSEAPATAKYDVYQPVNRYGQLELLVVLSNIRPTKDSQGTYVPRYKIVVIDEANRFFPPRTQLPQIMADYNDQHRHYGMSLGFIARRPTQVQTDLIELAAYKFIFRLTGRNDTKYLNDLAAGLGDEVSRLPSHHYVLVEPDMRYQTMPPVKPNSNWLQHARRESRV